METDWHRLFGLVLMDFFAGTAYVVETEKDLSAKKQLLDVVIVRRGEGTLARQLPDGMGDLAGHNLITFKSHQEALDDWALKELTGHYVNYRKQVSPSVDELLPESEFRLFAVCARFPQLLADQTQWAQVQEGVYDCTRGTDVIRVVVARQLPQVQHNAMLALFSASRDQVRFAMDQYRQQSPETSTVLYRLFARYTTEGIAVPYTLEEFRRQFAREFTQELSPSEKLDFLLALPAEDQMQFLDVLPPERRVELLNALPPGARVELLNALPPGARVELLNALPPGARVELLNALPPGARVELLNALPQQQRVDLLNALPPEMRSEFLAALPPEVRGEWLRSLPEEERVRGLSIAARLKGLSPEQIRAYLRQVEGESTNQN